MSQLSLITKRISKKIQSLGLQWSEFRHSLKYMSKERYRFWYNVVIVSTTVTTTSSYLAFNTIFLDKYKSLVQMYSSGEPAPLEGKLELLALRVWNEAHVARKYKLQNMIEFFPCVGCEPFSAGCLETRTGAIIGLPYYFTFETVDDVKTIDMQFFGEHDPYMRWRSEAGQQLIQSLVLSEKAKKFAIAREIHITNTFRVTVNSMNIMFSTFLSIALGQLAIHRFNIKSGRLLTRIFSLMTGVIVYLFIDEVLTYNWNMNADEAAVNQGDDYFEGAIEYYDKLRKRNAALYELLGPRGQSMFTKEGNVKGWFGGIFGTTSVPVIKRLEHFEEMKSKKEVLNKKEDNNETDSESLKE